MIAEYTSLEQARLAVLELEQHGAAQRVTIAERRKRTWFPWLSRGRHSGFILVMLGSPAAIAQARDYLHAARSNGQAEPFTGSVVPPSVDELIDVAGAELVSRKRPAVLVARSRSPEHSRAVTRHGSCSFDDNETPDGRNTRPHP